MLQHKAFIFFTHEREGEKVLELYEEDNKILIKEKEAKKQEEKEDPIRAVRRG